MLGTLRSRRLTALACLLAASATTRPVIAQQLLAPTDQTQDASLLSDCDITVQSCGILGGELYGGSSPDNSSGSAGTSTLVCGSGIRVVCKTFSGETCAQWVIVEMSGKVTISPTSAGVGGAITQVCGEYVTNTVTWYVFT